MANAKNKVIAGDYKGKEVQAVLGQAYIILGLFKKTLDLIPENVSAYELVTDEHRKSASSGAVRGLVGGALLGPVGLLAGSMSAKTKGIYQVVIKFKDGKTSLLEVNEKIYKAITSQLALVNVSNRESSNEPITKTVSVSDELLKLKELLDAGVITKKEFEQQKSKLLG